MEYNEITEKFSKIYEKYPIVSLSKIGDGTILDSVPILSFGEGNKNIVFKVRDSYSFEVLLHFIKEFSSLYITGGKIYGVPVEYIHKNFCVNVVAICNCEEYVQGLVSNYFLFTDNIISIIDVSDTEEIDSIHLSLKYSKEKTPFLSYISIKKDLFSFFL